MTETPPILVLADTDATYYLLPHRPFGGESWNTSASAWSTADGTLVLHRKSDAIRATAGGMWDWWSLRGSGLVCEVLS